MRCLKLKNILPSLGVAVSILIVSLLTGIGHADETPQVQLAPEYVTNADEICFMIIVNEQEVIICVDIDTLTSGNSGA